LKNYDKDVLALRNAKGTLEGLKEKERYLQNDCKDLELNFKKE